MVALSEALLKNDDLEHLHINDNWMKEEAIDKFCDYLSQSKKL